MGLKSEKAIKCHRGGLTKIDPETTAMCFQMIAAQQAAAPGSEVIGGEEAAGMSKATVSTASVNIVGGYCSILNSWPSSAGRRKKGQGNTDTSHSAIASLVWSWEFRRMLTAR